jgi:hypothetical protein
MKNTPVQTCRAGRRRLSEWVALSLLLLPLWAVGASEAMAQGVTTSSVSGTITGAAGNPLTSASIQVVHEPSGTRYGTLSRADGRFFIPGMRVGGPYTVTVTLIGYATQQRTDVALNLGVTTDLTFVLQESAVQLEGITVTSERDAIISSDRTGAATSVTREAINALPSITGRIADVARLTPQYSGNLSFAGQDNRLNNITVDGAYFNNSFGLAGQPGDRTGVAPISLQAIEQVQVNVAPYDVRQGNFVGAGVNTVTRSGTNDFRGSLYYRFRDAGLVGEEAGDIPFNPGTFEYSQVGGWLSGPIVRNRLFFFASYEDETLAEPGTLWTANTGGQTVEGTVTRVLASDLDQLSSYLQNNFGYATGPYQGYDHEVPATRFLGKLDFNLDDRNKFSMRYTHLDSFTDVLLSNSSSLGWGNRRTRPEGLNFQNSNYQILENIRSAVGEWNSLIGDNMSNQLIVGYTTHDESRAVRGGSFFPMVDIREGGDVYTTFGYEPFTPNNELRYNSFQVQNNFTRFGVRHHLTFGISAERYESENVFFPGSQSAYVYNSLADFYTDANDYLANPNRTVSPVTLQRFQVRWSNVPGQEKPIQPLEVFYVGAYAQDEWQAMDNLKVTLGARIDVPFFGDTGFDNPLVDGMTFRDEDGNNVRYSTSKLPDPNPLFSPRIGVNWDVRGDRSTQVRGGTGIFTGRPAYVWISNQIGENGILTGFEQLENTTARPFNPDPDHYKPSQVTGQPAASYGLAFSDPDFKFPQLWRTNVAVDQRLPWGLIGTGEFMYSRDVNGVYYINANLADPSTQFSGADSRPRWTSGNRIVSNITSAVVLKNQSDGYSWNIAASLEKPFAEGTFLKAGYSYGVSKNTVDPGSIAFGSWNNNQHSGNPNNPGVAFSSNSPGHRFFLAASGRREYLNFGATTLSLFFEGFTLGNASYTYQGDINGDGGTSNDLIYIPRDVSEMNFQTYTTGGVTYTADQQAQAWDAYIRQDPYLSKNRGGYAERGGLFLPMVYRADLSISQELFAGLAGRRNTLSLRADILNVGNLLNRNWGLGQRLVSTQPLIVPSGAQGGPADAQGRAQYRLRAVRGQLMSTTFEQTAILNDVYRIQLGLVYNFN